MMQLRQSKGTLGNLARIHHAEVSWDQVANGNDESRLVSEISDTAVASQNDQDVNAMAAMQEMTNDERKAVVDSLNSEAEKMMADGRNRILHSIEMQAMHLLPEQRENVMKQMEGKLRNDVENFYNDKMNQINARYPEQSPIAASEQDEASKRTSLLSRLYGFTGEVKIPLLVDMLNRWLADPIKGKICIFAHHISVLDSIRDGACLSNETDSTREFIRIDGSTLPRHRQEQITAFQTDPSIRVALLGITAAGVAVTLTASSTVWFAELFWTPAIMIQAEDRVHRMYGKVSCSVDRFSRNFLHVNSTLISFVFCRGQSSKVECLYFVARGTLDDVLWKLIEKKFQDLGEFIEGRAKEKIIVNKIYKCIKELHASVFPNLDGFEEDEEEGIEEIDLYDVLPLDDDFYHDIEEFGEEEQRMLRQLEVDETETRSSPAECDVKIEACATVVDGKSEDDAIDLVDDDEEEEECRPGRQALTSISMPNSNITQQKKVGATENESLVVGSKAEILPSVTADMFSGCRLYKIVFCQPKLGIEVLLHEGRVVVGRISEERLNLLGNDSKPAIGDILVSIAGFSLSLTHQLEQYATYLKYVLQKPPVELCFLEVPVFAAQFREMLEEKGVYKKKPQALQPAVNVNGEIELLDDD
jgi:SWI/SNF-related matrix-associated actin-dependent regulator 1 of chromatin subfamily A